MTSRDKFLVCHTLLKIIVRMVGSITLSIGISLLVIQISKQSHQSHEYVSLLILVHNSRLDLLSIQNTKIKYSLVSIISTVRLAFQGFDFEIVQYF